VFLIRLLGDLPQSNMAKLLSAIGINPIVGSELYSLNFTPEGNPSD